VPTRVEVARLALMGVVGGAALVMLFEAFRRHCL
jgi:hypothetical protein